MDWRRLWLLAGGIFCVIVGVNLAPTLYAWQGYAFDWTRSGLRREPTAAPLTEPQLRGQLQAQREGILLELREALERAAPPVPVLPVQVPPPVPEPRGVPAPGGAELELQVLRERVSRLEQDQRELTKLLLEQKRALQERPVQQLPRRQALPGPLPGPKPVRQAAASRQREFLELMEGVPVGRITARQEEWLRVALRRSNLDLARLKQSLPERVILFRYGDRAVWDWRALEEP